MDSAWDYGPKFERCDTLRRGDAATSCGCRQLLMANKRLHVDQLHPSNHRRWAYTCSTAPLRPVSSRRRRIVAVLLAFAAYGVAFLLLAPRIDLYAVVLGIGPVLLAAWLFGGTGGIVAALLGIVLTLVLLSVSGYPLSTVGIVPPLLLLVLGGVLGHLRDLYGHIDALALRLGQTDVQVEQAGATLRVVEQEREQLRSMIEQAPVAVAMFDLELRYVAYSRQWLTNYLAGLIEIDLSTEGSLVGRTHDEVCSGVPECWRADYRRVLDGEVLIQKDGQILQRDGSTAAVHWAAASWKTPDGSPAGIVLVIHGVDELVATREAALEAARIKGEFLATMSHEIRTPLNAVIGMNEVILGTALSDQQREYASIVRSSGTALLALVDDILDFSKIEAGRMLLEPSDFTPAVLLESVAEMVVALAREKHLGLLTFVAPDVPQRVRGDPGRLRQVLLNLTGNAIKFTNQGEVSLRLTMDVETDTTVILRFAVYDTGIGIDPSMQHRLFQPFMQIDSSTSRKYGGTGLGLAISKRLLELMGGTLNFETIVGQGTTFWFSVPLERIADDEALDVPATLYGLRALVIDSSATNRAIVRGYLEAWGMHGDGAATPSEALARLRVAVADGESYRLVLLDIERDENQAREFMYAITHEPDLLRTRLVLMVPFDGTEPPTERPYIAVTKPIKQATLLDAIITAVTPPVVAPNLIEQHPRTSDTSPDEATILVVEDNPVNRKLTLLQLQKFGYTAHAVNHGREAVDAVTTRPYALVLMDCHMPEMDGFEATIAIRQFEKQRHSHNASHIPIIAMTANAMQGDREACLRVGMDDYLAKPVRAETLREMVSRWLLRDS